MYVCENCERDTDEELEPIEYPVFGNGHWLLIEQLWCHWCSEKNYNKPISFNPLNLIPKECA